MTWRLDGPDDDRTLVLAWREKDGPPVSAPTTRGFGSRLIRMGLIGTGGVELDYRDSGFEATFAAPLDEVQQS